MATGIRISDIANAYGFQPRTVLDIGAQIGDFSKECKALWPEISIFMIEATRECEPYLKEVGQPYKIAVLSDVKDKSVEFYKTTSAKTNTGNSLYKENTIHYEGEKLIIENRKTETLDQLFGSDAQFDLIKLDTQGSELDIMRGGLDIVKRSIMIIMEMSHIEYNQGAPTFHEADKFMEEIGFKRGIQIGYSTNDRGEVFQEDFVYVNKKYIK